MRVWVPLSLFSWEGETWHPNLRAYGTFLLPRDLSCSLSRKPCRCRILFQYIAASLDLSIVAGGVTARLGWCLTQGWKGVVVWVEDRRWTLELLVGSGMMLLHVEFQWGWSDRDGQTIDLWGDCVRGGRTTVCPCACGWWVSAVLSSAHHKLLRCPRQHDSQSHLLWLWRIHCS